MKVELMRVWDSDDKGPFNRWLLFDKNETMWGHRNENKKQIVMRWDYEHGDRNGNITAIMRYTGTCRVSEAVATISDFQNGGRP